MPWCAKYSLSVSVCGSKTLRDETPYFVFCAQGIKPPFCPLSHAKILLIFVMKLINFVI